MPRKIPVALICTHRADGRRTYTAYAKSGGRLQGWTAGDHGHGAHLCQQACIAAGFWPTTAVWTDKIFREHSYREPTATQPGGK
jgi:hypothetical protein